MHHLMNPIEHENLIADFEKFNVHQNHPLQYQQQPDFDAIYRQHLPIQPFHNHPLQNNHQLHNNQNINYENAYNDAVLST